jgi:hypothetical protein
MNDSESESLLHEQLVKHLSLLKPVARAGMTRIIIQAQIIKHTQAGSPKRATVTLAATACSEAYSRL